MKCERYSFLFEIISQEIPAKMGGAACKKLCEIFLSKAKNFHIFANFISESDSSGLTQEGVLEKCKEFEINDLSFLTNGHMSFVKFYHCSSRIAFKLDLLIFKISEEKIIKGPPVQNCHENAKQKFLEKNNAVESDLEVITEKNQEFYSVKKISHMNIDQKAILNSLAKICEEALRGLKWPVSMKFEGANGCEWIRPVMSILCGLEGSDKVIHPINFEFAGVKSGLKTFGHKILSALNSPEFKPAEFELKRICDYAHNLKQHHVIVREKERFDHIVNSAKNLDPDFANYLIQPINACTPGDEICFKDCAGHIRELFDELVCIADMPNLLICDIDEEFLSLPRELIEYTMISHQRYIPLISSDGLLKKQFLVLIDHLKPSEVMKAGYERVLRARLLDSKFFYERFLEFDFNVCFDERLSKKCSEIEGLMLNQHSKMIVQLAKEMKNSVNDQIYKDLEISEKCFLAAKLDTCFELISEYPALRGIMAEYFWAEKLKSSKTEVLDFFGSSNNNDFLPRIQKIARNFYYNSGEIYKRDFIDESALEARFLAAAEKIIRLRFFFFQKGQNPTGSKDPFALKRDFHNLSDMILVGFNFEIEKDKSLQINLNSFLFQSDDDLGIQDLFKNFIFKNLEQKIYEFLLQRNFLCQKDFMQNIISWVLNESKADEQKSKSLFFSDLSSELNISKICQKIAYLLKLKNNLSSDFEAAYKRLSQIYKKKYLDYDLSGFKLGKPDFLSNYESAMLDLYSDLSAKFDLSYDCYESKIDVLQLRSGEISKIFNEFFDNIFIEDEDQEKKTLRVYILKEFFNLIEGVLPFSVYFSH